MNDCSELTAASAIIQENSHFNKNTSELEYIVEKVSVLLQYLFEPRSSLYFKWEKSSYSVSDDRCKDIRLDLVLFHGDQEIGCGEIKSNCTDVKLLDKDKARIAETMKRQLHKRIISSRGLNEFKTFGFFFNGVQLELYTMTFSPESVNEHYQLYQEVDLKVPCFRDTYNNLEETLEYFKALKGIIENRLPQDPTNTPLLKQNYVTLFQPTFRFTKS